MYIFVLESVLWTTPRARRTFGTTPEQAEATREMAYNQGWYNLFLAVVAATGVVLTALGHDAAGPALVLAGCGSMAAAAAVLLLLGGGIVYALPDAYVSLDVNPSIEYTVNRFDRVLRVRPVNEDAAAIVASLARTRNVTIGEALTQSVSVLSTSHYLEDEDGTVLLLSVASGSAARNESLAQTLTETAQAATGESPTVRVECVTGSRQDARTAQELGVTLGKKAVVDALQSDTGADKHTYQQ